MVGTGYFLGIQSRRRVTAISQGAAGNIDIREKIKVSIPTGCLLDVRVFRNKIAFVSRAFFRFPCTRRQEDDDDCADHYKMKYNADNNAPLYRLLNDHFHHNVLETMAPHFE